MLLNIDNSTHESAGNPVPEAEDDLAKSKGDKQPQTAQAAARAEDKEVVSVAIQMEHPQPEELRGRNRGEKYEVLARSAAQHREMLVLWIAERGWIGDVHRLSEPNAFGLLFADCTREVAAHLCDAPGVLDVSPAEPFEAGIAPLPVLPPPSPNGVYHSAG